MQFVHRVVNQADTIRCSPRQVDLVAVSKAQGRCIRTRGRRSAGPGCPTIVMKIVMSVELRDVGVAAAFLLNYVGDQGECGPLFVSGRTRLW